MNEVKAADLSARTRTCVCGACVIWAVSLKGKPAPINPEPAPTGNIILSGGDGSPLLWRVANAGDPAGPRYINHFATCPDAEKFRRR